MNGNFLTLVKGIDPLQVEIDFLKSKFLEARRSGNVVMENLILRNLRGFEELKAK